MISPLDGITPAQVAKPGSARVAENERDADFASLLGDAVTKASQAEEKSEDLAKRFADGDPNVGIHETMIAAEEASVRLRYAVTLKNKLLDAYRDLMNTQV